MFCLFVWFGFNVAFNNLSVISRQCLDVAGSSMLTFRVLPHWNITPQTLWHDIPPSHIILTLSWPVLALFSQCYFLYFRQAKEQLVPFLKSLVWPGLGSNPQPPGHKADAVPLSHCAGSPNMRKKSLKYRINISLQQLTLSPQNFWSAPPSLNLDMSTDANRGSSLNSKTEWQTMLILMGAISSISTQFAKVSVLVCWAERVNTKWT